MIRWFRLRAERRARETQALIEFLHCLYWVMANRYIDDIIRMETTRGDKHRG